MNQRHLQIRDIRLSVRIDLDSSGRPVTVAVAYQPSSDGGPMVYLEGDFSVRRDQATELWPQLDTLIGILQAYAPGGELAFGDDRVPFTSQSSQCRSASREPCCASKSEATHPKLESNTTVCQRISDNFWTMFSSRYGAWPGKT